MQSCPGNKINYQSTNQVVCLMASLAVHLKSHDVVFWYFCMKRNSNGIVKCFFFKFDGHKSHLMNLKQGDVSHLAGILGSNKMQIARHYVLACTTGRHELIFSRGSVIRARCFDCDNNWPFDYSIRKRNGIEERVSSSLAVIISS